MNISLSTRICHQCHGVQPWEAAPGEKTCTCLDPLPYGSPRPSPGIQQNPICDNDPDKVEINGKAINDEQESGIIQLTTP